MKTTYRTDQVRHCSRAACIPASQETRHTGRVCDSLDSELRGAANTRCEVVEEERTDSLGIPHVTLLAGSAGVDHLGSRLATAPPHTNMVISYADWPTSSTISQLVVAAARILTLDE